MEDKLQNIVDKFQNFKDYFDGQWNYYITKLKINQEIPTAEKLKFKLIMDGFFDRILNNPNLTYQDIAQVLLEFADFYKLHMGRDLLDPMNRSNYESTRIKN